MATTRRVLFGEQNFLAGQGVGRDVQGFSTGLPTKSVGNSSLEFSTDFVGSPVGNLWRSNLTS
ncbi:hypothetical protein PUN4_370035 [Paraburkholderia unamae]|nr:hypothetical protein PUN4_370035 [Paraburkholderia unamae]